MESPQSRRSPTVVRLFWTLVLGGCAGLAWGRPALIATGLAVLFVLLHRFDRPRRVRRFVLKTARAHAGTLALRRRQERFVDAYGNTIEDAWLREREYFLERTILPLAEARGYGAEVEQRWHEAVAIVERVARSVTLPVDNACRRTASPTSASAPTCSARPAGSPA